MQRTDADALAYRVTLLLFYSLTTALFSWVVFVQKENPWWWALAIFLISGHQVAQRRL